MLTEGETHPGVRERPAPLPYLNRDYAMKPNNVEQPPPIQEPLAELERQLISAYVAGAGETLHDLIARDDEAARQLLTAASLYARQPSGVFPEKAAPGADFGERVSDNLGEPLPI
jgi:hypothetical protein